MARNIAQNGALTPRMAGTLRSDDQNIKRSNANRNRNRFDMSYQNLMSLRFGEVRPFYYQQVINDDTQIFSNSSELWTMQMKSPLMSNFVGYKDYFYVPMKCILPNAWEAWKNNPLQEDDIPSDAYCNFDMGYLLYVFYEILRKFSSTSFSLVDSTQSAVSGYLGTFYLMWHLLSSNSLPVQLGINYLTVFRPLDFSGSYVGADVDNVPCIDEFFEASFSSPLDKSSLPEDYSDFTGTITLASSYSGNYSFRIFDISESGSVTLNVSEFRRMMSRMSYLYFKYPTTYIISYDKDNVLCLSLLLHLMGRVFSNTFGEYKDYRLSYTGPSVTSSGVNSNYTPDISPLIAYQMVGAQFYVNDQIDKIYTSADWLREMFEFTQYGASTSVLAFDYNGHSVPYDVFSLKYRDY